MQGDGSFEGDIVICFLCVQKAPMTDIIVHTSSPVTLVGGGDAIPQDVHEALTMAPTCVAVDGGMALVVEAGHTPSALIGDMDSVAPKHMALVPPNQRHAVSEQQTTDFDKALRSVSAPVVLGVGFLGGRVDHQLAAFHTLALHCHKTCILMGKTEIVMLAPPQIEVPTQAGDVVSLFPLAAVTGHSSGLEWPIEGLKFDPMQFVGTSNRATGPMRLEMTAPSMLLILPRALLAPIMAQDFARWPVRVE